MEDTQPKTFVFVLMPFDRTFQDVYEVGIKPACKDAGAYCERVDEQIFVENILERVYNQIAKADVIVAEMTGRNPNVFYEVGYAHALNKRVILLTRAADDIPFDLKHYPHIVYGDSIARLKSELEARVRWCIENPKETLSTVDVDLEFFLNGIPLTDNPEINVANAIKTFARPHGFDTGDQEELSRPVEFRQGVELRLNIGIHNPTNRVIGDDNFRLALLMPFGWDARGGPVRSITRQPGGQSVVNIEGPTTMFPGSWESIDVGLAMGMGSYKPAISEEPLECSLRMFTEVGAKDYSFALMLERSIEE